MTKDFDKSDKPNRRFRTHDGFSKLLHCQRFLWPNGQMKIAINAHLKKVDLKFDKIIFFFWKISLVNLNHKITSFFDCSSYPNGQTNITLQLCMCIYCTYVCHYVLIVLKPSR